MGFVYFVRTEVPEVGMGGEFNKTHNSYTFCPIFIHTLPGDRSVGMGKGDWALIMGAPDFSGANLRIKTKKDYFMSIYVRSCQKQCFTRASIGKATLLF